ncbi:MAG: HRDC domain-containing protein [Anaerolineales bacterium]
MMATKINLKPPQFINQQPDFEKLLIDLQREKILAVDTEANSLYAYQEQVCLIQLSTLNKDYILDPLALEDLSPLGKIFSDPGIEKVFHASEYDILIMYDEYHYKFRNLFDTMLAAQILGREKLGLDSLLEEMFGIKVNKKYQRANWGKRPLADDMLLYAQMDTHYLIRIRHNLASELEKKGFGPIASEDFSRACHIHRQPREEKIASHWRINGARKLTPQKAAVLIKLCNYRDKVARKINQPVFKVLSSQTLLNLAEQCPTSTQQLIKLDLPGKNVLKRHADGLVKAIQSGLASDPVRPPQRNHSDEATINREKTLRDWRKRTARKMNVNSAVILPRELLYAVISANPKTREELSLVLEDVPWRLERFGDEILSILTKVNKSRSAE